MNRAEEDVRAKVLTYLMELSHWQEDQGIEPVIDDPLTGKWRLSGGGMLEFSSGTFRWYRDADDMDGDYRAGTYSVTPGVMVNTGFLLDRGRELTNCYSVFPHYTHDRTDGQDKAVDYQGLYYIEQAGSADDITMYNHRTDGVYKGTRVPE